MAHTDNDRIAPVQRPSGVTNLRHIRNRPNDWTILMHPELQLLFFFVRPNF
jgi:hypothetical protein